MAKGNPVDEYKIVGDNLRWYSNIRFAQLTLFLAINAAIFHQVFSVSSLTGILSVLLSAGGIVTAAVFWYLEKRADDYWLHFMRRAEKLEKALKFRQYTDRPMSKLRTTQVIRLFILLVGVFWVIALVVELKG